MSQDYNKQAAAYHGIQNGKYAVRTADGKPGTDIVDFPNLKSISFDPTVDQQPVYANNAKIMAIVSDQGYTGAFGTTAQDRAFEIALGHVMAVSGGLADVNLNSFKRIDIYYEYNEKTANGSPYVVKVWALNTEISKASKSHSTDTNTAALGECSYPMTIYGDKIMDSEGTKVYRDANGNELTATRVISLPGDTGYEAFDDKVPVVKMKVSTPPTEG